MSDQSAEIKDLALALSLAQAEIGGAVKDSRNPHFGSNYADLESVCEAAREPLAKHKLAVTQTTEKTADGIFLVTTLMHASGQFIRGRCPLILQKQDMQGLGAAITYARRFALSAIVGIHQTDDDGETAAGRGQQDARGNPVATKREAKPAAKDPAPFTAQDMRGPVATSAVNTPEHCGGKMLVSKYNPNEFYCPKCKAKAPVAA
jgi:hypothetical protein